MAKVKSKSTAKKNTIKKNGTISVNDNTVNSNEEVFNNIDFDPELELKKINEGLKIDTEVKLPEIASLVIDELKSAKTLSNTLNNNMDKESITKVNEKIDILSSLSESLEKDINERISKLSKNQKERLNDLTNNINKTSFWGGVLNTW